MSPAKIFASMKQNENKQEASNSSRRNLFNVGEWSVCLHVVYTLHDVVLLMLPRTNYVQCSVYIYTYMCNFFAGGSCLPREVHPTSDQVSESELSLKPARPERASRPLDPDPSEVPAPATHLLLDDPLFLKPPQVSIPNKKPVMAIQHQPNRSTNSVTVSRYDIFKGMSIYRTYMTRCGSKLFLSFSHCFI